MIRILGLASLCLWIAALIIGTVARFTYAQASAGGGDGCRFADLGAMRIACEGFPGAGPVGDIFTVAWYWTWGMWWMITDLPYSWPLFAPAALTLWLAFRHLSGEDRQEP
jgi:hypothetical protein